MRETNRAMGLGGLSSKIIVALTLIFGLSLYFMHHRHVQELSAMQKQLGMCHARYEGFNLPVVLHTDVIKEAVLRLGGRWKNVPHHMNMTSSSTAGGIPKYLWQTMKQVPNPLPQYSKDMFANNPGWFVGTMDDDDVNLFMHTVFAKTSLLWAYRQINPQLGAMKADIWRYAVLYVYGGVYVDADSSFHAKLDDYLREDDGLILSTEGNAYTGCYTPDFYLGDPPGPAPLYYPQPLPHTILDDLLLDIANVSPINTPSPTHPINTFYQHTLSPPINTTS